MSKACLSDDDLKQFALGIIEPERMDEIADHLETCDSCMQRLSGFEDDSDHLLDLLKADVASIAYIIAADDIVEKFVNTKVVGGQVRLECPHCRNPIEVTYSSDTQDVACPVCQSTIRFKRDRNSDQLADGNKIIGKFELQEVVGRGGFGTVYRAIDQDLGRVVAIKVPRSGRFSNEEDEERFIREARASAKLNHPNIVPIFEVSKDADVPYIVTEFVEGETLAQAIEKQRFSFQQTASIVGVVARALHHSHMNGIIHRDLKPSNVMLQERENDELKPRVMDFGLARHTEGEVTLTADGCLMGTPAYAPPEQLGSTEHKIDARSDLYSIGVILYEMLTGELPFRGSLRMLIDQVHNSEPRPPRQINDRIPRDLETICLKCLEKNPAKRYANAEALAEDLERWLAGVPISARRVSSLEKSWRWCVRNSVVATLMALFSLSLIVGIISTSIFAYRASAKADDEIIARKKATTALVNEKQARDQINRLLDKETDLRKREQTAREKADRQTLLARKHAYAANMTLAYQAFHRDQRELAWRKLVGEYPQGQEDIRDFEWHCLWNLFEKPKLTCRGHAKAPLTVAFSPDGKRFASAGEDLSIRIWNAQTGEQIRVLKGHTVSTIRCIAFSPDGKTLASTASTKYVSKACEIKLWDLQTGEETHQIYHPHVKGDDPYCLSLDFTPDGRFLLTANSRQIVFVWSMETSEYVNKFVSTGPADWIDHIKVSQDGSTLVGGCETGQLLVWDFPTGKKRAELSVCCGWIENVGVSIDGRYVAYSSTKGQAELWDTETRQKIIELEKNNRVVGICFSNDGRTLFVATQNEVAIWDLATRKVRDTIKGHEDYLSAIAVAPDGDSLLTCSRDNTVQLWDVSPQEEALPGHYESVSAVAWSKDASILGSADLNGRILLWNSGDNSIQAEFPGYGVAIRAIAFHPNGKKVATAGDDNRIRIWDIEKQSQETTIRAHSASIHQIEFFEGGKRLLSASADGTVKIWDLDSNKLATTWELNGAPIQCFKISSNEDLLVVGDEGGWIYVYDLNTSRLRWSSFANSQSVKSIDFDKENKNFVTLGQDGTLKLWDVETGKTVRSVKYAHFIGKFVSLTDQGECLLVSSYGLIRYWTTWPRDQNGTFALTDEGVWSVPNMCAAFSESRRQLAIGCSDKTIRIIGIDPLNETKLLGQRQDLWSLAMSANGQTLALGGYRRIELMDTSTRKRATLAKELPERIVDLSVSKNGHLASVYGDASNQVDLFDIQKRRRISSFEDPPKNPGWVALVRDSRWGVREVEVFPDASQVVIASGTYHGDANTGGWMRIWDPLTKQQIAEFPSCDKVRSLTISKDGKLIAGEFRDCTPRSWIYQVVVRDSLTHEEVFLTPKLEGTVRSLAFSPDSGMLAVGRSDGKLRIWDIEKEKLLESFDAHTVNNKSFSEFIGSDYRAGVLSLAFSPDGRRLVSSGQDRTVKIWDLSIYQQVGELSGFSEPVNDLCFSPDGRLLAAARGNSYGQGGVNVWRADPVSDAEFWGRQKSQK